MYSRNDQLDFNLQSIDNLLTSINTDSNEYYSSIGMGLDDNTETRSVIDFNDYIKGTSAKKLAHNRENLGTRTRLGINNREDGFKRSDNSLDENKILELYISKVDKDQSELKQDMRDSEKRIENHIIQSENRMDERMDRIETLIISQNEKFDKIDDKIGAVNNEVSNKLDDYRKFMWGITISIFLAIAAMIVSLIIA